jgi:hypothetical protein
MLNRDRFAPARIRGDSGGVPSGHDPDPPTMILLGVQLTPLNLHVTELFHARMNRSSKELS